MRTWEWSDLVASPDGMDQKAMKHAQQRLHAAYLAIKERREAKG